MEGQMCLYDLYGEPDYHGGRDEIVRLTVEDRFEQSINLYICRCGENPQEKFRGCHEYFVACPTCGRRTKSYRHMYEAMQAWNRSLTLPDGYVTGDIRHKPKKKETEYDKKDETRTMEAVWQQEQIQRRAYSQ